MPEIEEECIFEVSPGNVLLQTQVNGDQLTIRGLHLTKENAAALSWMLNDESINLFEIEIKKKE